jgi:hypothetical protein
MTAFAFYIFMGAGKVKACNEMIGCSSYSACGGRLRRKKDTYAKNRYTPPNLDMSPIPPVLV